MATQCDRMLVHDYMRRHNEALRCVHLQLCVNYGLKSCKKIKNHTLQDLVASRDVEIRVGSRIQANMVIKYNNPDIFIVDKIRKKITIVEVGITGLKISTLLRQRRNISMISYQVIQRPCINISLRLYHM